MKFIIYIILSLLLLTLINCKSKSYDYLIYDLKKEELSFYDVPLEIKGVFNNSSNYSEKLNIEKGLICLGKEDSYKVENVKTQIGSWTAYVKLIDNNRNISYRMDYNAPIPYIILNKRLYLVDQYNPFSLKDFSSLKFTCYFLK